jgi:hypothetical protein
MAETIFMSGRRAGKTTAVREWMKNQRKETMDPTTKTALDALAAKINGFTTAATIAPFRLFGPASLTIKTRQSQYKKKSFLGDESFNLTSVYVGKKEMIAVFKSVKPTEYAYMEMPIDEAPMKLTGFQTFMEKIGADTDGVLSIVANQKGIAAEQERTALLDDPKFASW